MSSNSIYTNKLLRGNHIPMISYASTSPELSIKQDYPYFFRTVPSDIFQAKFVRNILQGFQWTYVSIVAAGSSHGQVEKGESGEFPLFRFIVRKRGIFSHFPLFQPGFVPHAFLGFYSYCEGEIVKKHFFCICISLGPSTSEYPVSYIARKPVI